MNAQKRFRPSLAPCALMFGMIALAAVLTVPVARASGDDRDERSGDPHRELNVLPPISLAEGQTLQVNYLNAGDNPFEIIPFIFDADGSVLKTGGAITLQPGQLHWLELHWSEAVRRTGRAIVLLRAGVQCDGSVRQCDGSVRKRLVVSGEVVEEATGRSSLYVPGKSSRPEPDREGRLTSTLAPVGIAAGQTLRVTFFNTGANPLEIIPCIYDGNGMHLKEGDPVTLAPGQMRSMELHWSEVSPPAGGRVEARGAAHVGRADAKHLVMSGEVVEDASGKSTLYVPGPLRAR